MNLKHKAALAAMMVALMSVVGSAQAVAARAGLLESGLSGWVLPTGDGGAAAGAGAQNQYKSIWNSVGSSFAALSGQFDGVLFTTYWSGAVFAPDPTRAWGFLTPSSFQNVEIQGSNYLAVAVRPGDVAAAVPEPQTYAMLLLGLGALTVAARRLRP